MYFISCHRKRAACIICTVLYIICILFGNSSHFAFWEDDLTYEGESIYNYLQVRENDRRVILSTNVLFGVQSVMEKQDGLTGMYYDYAMAAPVMAAAQDDAKAGQPVSILILGMGSGTYDHQCRSYFRDLDIKGVEIDEKITDLAHQYFALPEDADVTTYDGRAYLAADHEKYDVIMVDAYQDITIPFQMSSAEFFSMVRGHQDAGSTTTPHHPHIPYIGVCVGGVRGTNGWEVVVVGQKARRRRTPAPRNALLAH